MQVVIKVSQKIFKFPDTITTKWAPLWLYTNAYPICLTCKCAQMPYIPNISGLSHIPAILLLKLIKRNKTFNIKVKIWSYLKMHSLEILFLLIFAIIRRFRVNKVKQVNSEDNCLFYPKQSLFNQVQIQASFPFMRDFSQSR